MGQHKSRGAVYALKRALSDEIDNRIAGKTSADEDIFSTRDDIHGIYVRNQASWIAGVDLTCVSVWNSGSDKLKTVTLVAPDIGIGANHFKPAANDVFRYVTNENENVDLTVENTMQVSVVDIELVKFTTQAPAKITPSQILSSADLTRIRANGTPYLVINQTHKAFIGESNGGTFSMQSPAAPPRSPFWIDVIAGDSSHPGFALINRRAVLLGALEAVTYGPTLSVWIAEINQDMTALGSTYQLSVAETAAFSTINTITVRNGGSTEANGMYTLRRTFNDHDQYNLLGQSTDPSHYSIIYHAVTKWSIYGENRLYIQTAGNFPHPWDVPSWTAAGNDGIAPVPTVVNALP